MLSFAPAFVACCTNVADLLSGARRSKNGYSSSTFFNQTVDIIDKPRLVDTQLLFLFVIAAAVVSVLGKPLSLIARKVMCCTYLLNMPCTRCELQMLTLQ